MFKNINGVIIYERNNICAIVDSISPAIIAERMIQAGYNPVVARFIAYNNGVNTIEQAIQLGKEIRLLQ